MEHLARYIIRTSFSQERMIYLSEGSKVIYESKACPRRRSVNGKDVHATMTIAKFLMDHHEKISQLSIFQDHQDLRDLSRERESLCHLISATKVEIKRVLRTIFPELESIGNLFTGVMLRFLQQYPSARLVRGAKRKAIAKALKGPYVGTN